MKDRSFPKDWKSLSVVHLFYIKGRLGWKGLRASEFIDNGPFLITGTDFICGKIDWSKSYHISYMRFIESPEIIVKAGDILLTKDGTIGKVAYIDFIPSPGKASLNSHLLLVRSKNENIDTKFVFFVLQSDIFKAYIEANQSGSTLRGLPQKVFEKFHVPVPLLAEQREIASILSKIDQTIEKNEAIIQKYMKIKQGLTYDLFTRGITPDGKLRPIRKQSPKLYKKTHTGWIPNDWSFKSIEATKESLVDGPFGSNLKTEHYVVDPGVRVVRLQNIQATRYNDSDRAYISEEWAKRLIRNKVHPGDILIAGLGEERYPVGRACQYPEEMAPAINKADCFRLRFKETIDNTFAMYYLNTHTARVQIRKYEQGVTRPRINLGNLNRVIIPIPSLREQKRISKALCNIDVKIDKELQLKANLEKQKAGLMHDLLTGKVRVKVD